MNTLPVEKKSVILVVEDDPVLLALVAGSLRPDGHELIETSNPLEALRIAARRHREIDLVLAEVDCRPISGIELANRLMRSGAQVPILFMSGSRSVAAIIVQSLGHGAVIEEPFTGAELRAAVRRYLTDQGRKPRPQANAFGDAETNPEPVLVSPK